ncbi:MAG TPA: MiaB/RimO family radical SAM methylthiotransferase [Gemmatimonadales bacterium]|nr:MiaB/RimO family radical SAM methylthiotransferase [Gemmatimonadales bacterium]
MRVYLHTFGCRANQYDTDVVRQKFSDAGAVIVDDPGLADLAVINSCTVTHESEVKLRRLVRHVAKSGTAQTIVMGCAAALDDGSIAALPSVRAVVANADPVTVLRAAGMEGRGVVDVGAQHAAPLRSNGRSRALLKIQDGCDEHCTFCATTIARGNNRSRPVEELVEEARGLAEHHAEIVITGVHIGTYGQDRFSDAGRKPGENHKVGPESLAWSNPRAAARGQNTLGSLLEALITAVPQARFRLSSVEATEVDDTLAHLLIAAPRNLAAHLHAPLQSGSDRVLKRMGRHWYTAESYRARIEWLAERLPVFGLGADIIAGFPGETDADHHASLALLRALPFTYLHVFPFSVRPDAPAARMAGQLPAAVVRDRARELRELGDAKAAAYRERRRGAWGDGVVSGRQGGKVELLTEDYLAVHIRSEDWTGQSRFAVEID